MVTAFEPLFELCGTIPCILQDAEVLFQILSPEIRLSTSVSPSPLPTPRSSSILDDWLTAIRSHPPNAYDAIQALSRMAKQNMAPDRSSSSQVAMQTLVTTETMSTPPHLWRALNTNSKLFWLVEQVCGTKITGTMAVHKDILEVLAKQWLPLPPQDSNMEILRAAIFSVQHLIHNRNLYTAGWTHMQMMHQGVIQALCDVTCHAFMNNNDDDHHNDVSRAVVQILVVLGAAPHTSRGGARQVFWISTPKLYAVFG